ncbi:AMP-binding protein [Rhodococcus gannanensis]|uniref:AMP-binding protein n=1 Tax=Rhodococcus gannanensis TaxID=1960308 RepID=A0ABW4P411_9NOCA
MSAYEERIWLAHYPAGVPADARVEFDTALAMFRATLVREPEAPAIHYFDATVTYRDLDEMSDALAVALGERGIGKGDRVALVLQNVPQFHVAVLAAWKLGAVVVPLNPMYRDRELRAVLSDSGAAVVICLESVRDEVASAAAGAGIATVITTSELAFRTRDEPRIFGDGDRAADAADDLLDLIDRFRGRAPADVPLTAGDLAYLPYTSGTTGPPKGSMNTHANVVFTAQIYRDWTRLGPESVVYAVAPLFHITGLIANIAAPLLAGAATILTCRFHPVVAAEVIAERRATATIGAITVFIAWTNSAEVTAEQLSSLRSVYSGGAPVPHAALAAFREKFGHYIHNGYGLTETTSPAIVVPHGVQAPVDSESGAVSVGVPVSGTVASVVDEGGDAVPVGEIGEIVVSGPQVAAGYWHRPYETERAMPSGRFHTGDVGFMDSGGWFYIVDRKKDQINASGFKVWPREVEDVLYEHPAIREAAVVGVVDAYRGETVKAVVSLKSGLSTNAAALQEFCRDRLAAYKCPRIVEVRDDLPKTVSGKILRRALRDA